MRAHNKTKQLLNESSPILCETLAKCDELYVPSRGNMHHRQQVMLFNECILFTPEGEGINHPRIDTVLLCTLENGMSHYDSFTVGVEIKESIDDLYRSPQQLDNYLSHTDYLFLGVREKLLPEACEYVKYNPYCGVFNIKTGQIHKAACRQPLNPYNRLRLMNTLIFRMRDNFMIFKKNTSQMFGTRAFGHINWYMKNSECVKDLESLVKIRDERLKNYNLYIDRQLHYYTLSRYVFLTDGWPLMLKCSKLDEGRLLPPLNYKCSTL